MELKGKVALITGGAKRLGKAIAEALADRGASIAVHYRTSAQEAEATAGIAAEKGVRAFTVRADLTVEDEVREMMETVHHKMGRLDIVVNNAAIFYRTPWETLNGDVFRTFLEANVTSVFLCSYYATPYLKSTTDGVIVNITDTSALRPWTQFLPYCVSKAGVISLTVGLARLLAPEIRVNAVALGTVLPPDAGDGDEWAEKMKSRTLLGRIGTPQDAVEAVLFCIRCSYVTGAIIPVDGGRWLK